MRELAETFWRRSGMVPGTGVRVIRAAVEAGLPVSVVEAAALTPDVVGGVLRRIGVDVSAGSDVSGGEPLHGALFAQRGKAVLFVRSTDPPAQQRFTLAHEAAHFLLHHEAVRAAAVDVAGVAILEVLDGDRPPTTAERLTGVLTATAIGPHVHLMRADGEHRAEGQADALALELLAPRHLRHGLTPREVAERFGIPEACVPGGPVDDPVVTWARDVLVGGGS